MLPINHKTVFLLDESAYFVQTSCNQRLDVDVTSKNRHPSVPGDLLVEKTLWTCAVEAISEYCRIVWDIYPENDKLITFASALMNSKPEVQLTWAAKDQQLSKLNTYFAKNSFAALTAANLRSHSYGPPQLHNGAKHAIELLGELSELQVTLQKDRADTFSNKGRLICISSFNDDAQIADLQKAVVTILGEHNAAITAESEKAAINGLDLIIVNTYPINDTSLTSSKILAIPEQRLSNLINSEVHTSKSGTYLAQKLVSLVLRHYNLASTTVTGIPMKEEQNASSSANYDVEILHPCEAHVDLHRLINIEGVRVPKEGVEYHSIVLKWTTPRSTSTGSELHFSTEACRITPVDVNSRPSSCLTNFLLSGRTVMLEMPRAKSKVMSHMLSSHNNELYIHTLSTGRSILDDPPSISEGTGGRVTDYRITDFAELIMKRNRLVRQKDGTAKAELQIAPLIKAQLSLKRVTSYFPYTISSTILYSIAGQIQQLFANFPNEVLTADQLNECRNAIYNIVSMEMKQMALPIPTITTRGKGPKREELYRILWKELDHYLSRLATTPEHQSLISCVAEIHSDPTAETAGQSTSAAPNKKTNGQNGDQQKIKADELAGGWKGGLADTRYNQADKDKAESANEPVRKKPKAGASFEQFFGSNCRGQESLLSLWTKKLASESQRRAEFAGRLAPNGAATLYESMWEAKKLAAAEEKKKMETLLE